MVILLLSVAVMYASEQKGNPILAKLGANEALTSTQAGGNMEGKEVRFGITNSILFATVTTDTSCGAVNNGHDSLTPLAGGMALLNMALARWCSAASESASWDCSSSPSSRCSSPASWWAVRPSTWARRSRAAR